MIQNLLSLIKIKNVNFNKTIHFSINIIDNQNLTKIDQPIFKIDK